MKNNSMLDELGLQYHTDKASDHHDYCKIYEHYLAQYRESNISLIECGVGGYEYPDRGGESIRMWYEYFRKGKIIGIDLYEKKGIINDRTEFWKGSQIDARLLCTIIAREGYAAQRVFIDDASHVNSLSIQTFAIVFPVLKSGDLYFVEDCQCSYWGKHYDGNPMPGARNTTMGFFTHLTHQLNAHVLNEEFVNEYAGMIDFIHFYKELIVIKRK